MLTKIWSIPAQHNPGVQKMSVRLFKDPRALGGRGQGEGEKAGS